MRAESGSRRAGLAGQRYLAACADARKAWQGAQIDRFLHQPRIERVQAVLSGADAQAIAATLCDIAGPMHPGDMSRAGAASTAHGAALTQAVVHAVLCCCMPLRARHADLTGEAVPHVLDVERLRQMLVDWIDHGRVDHVCKDGEVVCDARRIAEFLAQQDPGGDEPSRATLRLACLAATAPAVEIASIVARMPVETRPDSQAPQGSGSQQGDAAACGKPPSSSPMARADSDDGELNLAFERLKEWHASE
jgi:hypothetical protein